MGNVNYIETIMRVVFLFVIKKENLFCLKNKEDFNQNEKIGD